MAMMNKKDEYIQYALNMFKNKYDCLFLLVKLKKLI